MSSTLSESILQVNTNAMAPTPNNSHESHPIDDSSNESMSDVKSYECQTAKKMKRERDDDDTIAPEAARERFISAVKSKRINENATKVANMTMEQLMTDDSNGPVLYVPAEHKKRIMRLYGGFTMLDFDELYDMNSKIGAPYPNCFNSMIFWMNQTNGALRDQWLKVRDDKVVTDVFNLVQSAVRSRVGECVWYA